MHEESVNAQIPRPREHSLRPYFEIAPFDSAAKH
jgi:hypothetical protein